MHLKLTIIPIMFLSFASAWAQKVTPSVIASAGAVMKGNSASLEWTLGEVVTETRSAGNLIVTQGFHQANLGVPTATTATTLKGLSVYPNPVGQVLHVENGTGTPLQMSLYGANGQLLLSGPLQQGLQDVPLDRIQQGVYHLHISNGDSGEHFTIEKIN